MPYPNILRCPRNHWFAVSLRYVQIKTGPRSDEPPPWWCRALQRIIPSGNEDLESLYPNTRTWWLEVDEAGVPQREIGFDADMKPIVLGPVGRNCGFLIDASDDWSDCLEDSAEAAAGFEKAWQDLWPRFAHLNQEASQHDSRGNAAPP